MAAVAVAVPEEPMVVEAVAWRWATMAAAAGAALVEAAGIS
jgi:hypothetical protein